MNMSNLVHSLQLKHLLPLSSSLKAIVFNVMKVRYIWDQLALRQEWMYGLRIVGLTFIHFSAQWTSNLLVIDIFQWL